MTIRHIVAIPMLLAAFAAPLAAQKTDTSPDEGARGRGRAKRDPYVRVAPIPRVPWIDADALYDQARQAVENSQWDRAIVDFDRLMADVNAKLADKFADKINNRMDAALYWKAYSQSKLAQSEQALQTIQDLAKQFSASPWVKDAQALALEIQQAAGQPVSADLQSDEELKLLALRGLMRSDPDKGLPIIERMLAGNASPRVRDRALFVLSQSRSARAREIMANTARNNANPDLQLRAIRYLGLMGGTDNRDLLAGIYRTASDASVKRGILQAYFQSGDAEKISELARTERDSDLRRMAIRDLGLMNRPGAAETLVSIYNSDSSSDVRRAVVESLFIQRNAKALVDLARTEKDPQLKKEIVSRLSVMKAPEATDYLLELLK